MPLLTKRIINFTVVYKPAEEVVLREKVYRVPDSPTLNKAVGFNDKPSE
jgi:hypothetical protein